MLVFQLSACTMLLKANSVIDLLCFWCTWMCILMYVHVTFTIYVHMWSLEKEVKGPLQSPLELCFKNRVFIQLWAQWLGQIWWPSNTKEPPVSYLALGQLAHASTSRFTSFLGNSLWSLCFQLKSTYFAHLAISIFMIYFLLRLTRNRFPYVIFMCTYVFGFNHYLWYHNNLLQSFMFLFPPNTSTLIPFSTILWHSTHMSLIVLIILLP